jgi:hypothetical protein
MGNGYDARDYARQHPDDGPIPESDTEQVQPLRRRLPSPGMPMNVARAFVAECFTQDDELSLRYWRDGFLRWRRSHWEELERAVIVSNLYRFTEHASYMTNDGLTPWAPNRKRLAICWKHCRQSASSPRRRSNRSG